MENPTSLQVPASPSTTNLNATTATTTTGLDAVTIELLQVNRELLLFKLLFAVSRGDIEEVKRLVEDQGADTSGHDYDLRTPLHISAAKGHIDICNYLLLNNNNNNKKCDVNAVDRFNNIPIDDAIRHGHRKITQLLIDHGSHKPSLHYEGELIQASSIGDYDTVLRLLDNQVNPSATDYDGRSALHLAAASHHVSIVSLLLARGADPMKIDRWSGTPLQDALRSSARIGDDAVVTILKAAMGLSSSSSASTRATATTTTGTSAIASTAGIINPFVWLQTSTTSFFQTFLCFQIVILILFALFVTYDQDAKHLERYPMFQDVHVMIFIGFGFLMTFLRKYGYSSVGINMLIGAIVMQWYPLIATFWENVFHNHHEWELVKMNVGTLIMSDFAAAAVLISFGAVLGKTTPTQMFFIAIAEPILYSLNEAIGLYLNVSDLGGSMIIHTFGAFFGLSISWVLSPPRAREKPSENAAVYHSDLFSMIGTIFLWMYWLSFNAAFADGLLQSQAIINTLLSLSASCVTAFAFSQLLRSDAHAHASSSSSTSGIQQYLSKFNMVDIQNATLAGGVAMGTCSNMNINPSVAIAIGMAAGCISVLGFVQLLPYLERKIGLHDTCGVLNLHGLPSILGAICGAIAARYTDALPGATTLPATGGVQFAYLLITLSISISSGLMVGKILQWYTAIPDVLFNDSFAFEVPEVETPYFFDKRGENAHSAEKNSNSSGGVWGKRA